MDGTLLRAFPFFALVAYEAGGIFRLLLLLLASPLAGLVYHLVSAYAGIRVLVFATFVGMKVSDINSVARTVLPKFYSTDLHSETWKVFSSCGKRCVLTANLRIMVEPFLKEFLGADMVLGTEIASFRGRATGFVQNPGILVGNNNADARGKAFGAESEVEAVMGNEKLPKPVIFHDGRLVVKPTPLMALLIVLWIPVGFLLSCIRVAAGSLLPTSVLYYAWWALGVRIYIKGTPPPPATKSTGQTGVIFICSHRTVIDPVVLAAALGRSVSTVTYSVSRLTEIISPIKTVRLTRDRVTDANTIKNLLEHSDVVICPEGTTCREPFLLRFSALFAELSDELVPVAMVDRRSMFHGTTARGWKAMDPYYFFMNPSPAYEVTFLNKLPKELTCGGGNSSFDVANSIQKMIGESLSYECTTFTRKDKYRYLAGNDGMVPVKSAKAKNI